MTMQLVKIDKGDAYIADMFIIAALRFVNTVDKIRYMTNKNVCFTSNLFLLEILYFVPPLFYNSNWKYWKIYILRRIPV
jgi:hypothetical protein